MVVNILIVILELVALRLSAGRNGMGMFQFYTEDSNLFAMFVSIVCIIFAARSLKRKEPLPRWVVGLKYLSACCLAVTFIVVLCVLAPMAGGVKGYQIMLFSGSMLYHHFLCPIVVLLSFWFLDGVPAIEKKTVYLALIPTAFYAAFAIVMNIAKVWEGPYPFLLVYQQPVYMSVIWCCIIMGIAAVLAWLICKIDRKLW